MSEDMVKDGYEDIVNIDISSVAIEIMRRKYEDIPQLQYMKMDVRDMSIFPDEFFDSVIDKGTLDSLMCGTEAPVSATQMLGEVSRLLKLGGTYMLITNGDPKVRMVHLNRPVYRWKIELYIIPRPGFEKPGSRSSSMKSYLEPVPLTENGLLPADFVLEDPESHFIYVCEKRNDSNQTKLEGFLSRVFMETDLDLATKDKEDFTALFEEDSDDNVEVWRALVDSEAPVLPKKGDLVVYFPQGHLEYAASITSSSSIEVPTLDLKPEIICRVQHVQLIANKNNDEICAHLTLLPEPEDNKENDEGCTQVTLLPPQKLVGQNPKGKVVIESGLDDEPIHKRKRNQSASRVFSKTLCLEDLNDFVLPWSASKILVHSDFDMFTSHEEVVAQDVQGREWTFVVERYNAGTYKLSIMGWEEFVGRKKLGVKDTVGFVRCQDGSLRLVIKRFRCECGVPESIVTKHYLCSNVLSPVADAILNKSMFHIFYCPRVATAGFVVPYENYMESITRPCMIGNVFRTVGSSRQFIMVVTGISELDPFKWPDSKWKCLMVRWFGDEAPQTQVISPWEVVYVGTPLSLMSDFSPKLKKPRISQQDSSHTNFDPDVQFKITPTHFKISKCSVQEIPFDPTVHNSLQYLEFESCLFQSPVRVRYFPIALKSFKITNCINSEHILALLMDQKGLSLESVEVDGSDSLVSLPIDKLPVSLKQLNILNCRNLKSLVISLDSEKQLTLTRILELRELVISDCGELEFLHEGLHNLIHLELLSITNCASLVSFPEGGLPKNCLKTIAIHECENLMSLPSQLHEFTSLQNLSVSGCPCLTSFPEADLPPNLVTLHISDCENLIHLSHWKLHKLKHLRRYSFSR